MRGLTSPFIDVFGEPDSVLTVGGEEAMTPLDASQLRKMRILDGAVAYTLVVFLLLGNWVPDRFLDIQCYTVQGLFFLALGIGLTQTILLRGQRGCIHNKCWAWVLVVLGLMHIVFRVGFGIINLFTTR